MTAEQWRPVPITPYDRSHEISDHGNLRRVMRDGTRRPIKLNRARSGHLVAHLWANGTRKAVGMHRLVLMAFAPHPEAATLEGCHNDGDPTNNRLDNLRWDTKPGNALDEVKAGRHYQTAKTHCSNGHEFTPANTVERKTSGGHTGRRCLECKRAAGRETARRRRAAAKLRTDPEGVITWSSDTQNGRSAQASPRTT